MKIYQKKDMSEQEKTALVHLQRRHTLMEGTCEVDPGKNLRRSRTNSLDNILENNLLQDIEASAVEEHELNKKMRKLSRIPTVVITESELASSSLYKNRKAKINSDDESADEPEPNMPTVDAENPEPRYLNDPNLKPVPIQVHRPEKVSSCCCYFSVAVAICLVSLGIIIAIGGIVYMELFSAFKEKLETTPIIDTNKDDLMNINEMLYELNAKNVLGKNEEIRMEALPNENKFTKSETLTHFVEEISTVESLPIENKFTKSETLTHFVEEISTVETLSSSEEPIVFDNEIVYETKEILYEPLNDNKEKPPNNTNVDEQHNKTEKSNPNEFEIFLSNLRAVAGRLQEKVSDKSSDRNLHSESNQNLEHTEETHLEAVVPPKNFSDPNLAVDSLQETNDNLIENDKFIPESRNVLNENWNNQSLVSEENFETGNDKDHELNLDASKNQNQLLQDSSETDLQTEHSVDLNSSAFHEHLNKDTERNEQEFNLNDSDHTQLVFIRPAVESKAVPVPLEFLRRIGFDMKNVSLHQPLSPHDMDIKFSLAEALKYLRSLDVDNKLPTSREKSDVPIINTKKEGESKPNVEAEQVKYLDILRERGF
ncbi:uncharacterized protein CDAR_595501 [Caerostris darwini]|uniref:Uncharacterized protein n=1 Tax=Caerostris darwini TaxID=1538125 RepID=A0AAV4NMR5_9ARAC|nr:uncharacterized protein CDAR_595501 [Caerostris darwini]